MPGHGLADIEHAGDIGLQQFLPLVVGEILERRAELDPGIADQDVDRADIRLDLFDGRRDRRRIDDVEHRGVDRVAFRAQRVGGTLDLLLRAAIENDGCAVLGQAARQAKADALARAGDQSPPSGEAEEVLHGFS